MGQGQNPKIENGSLRYHYKKPFSMFANVTDLSKWRREWDSNPRDISAYTLSKRAPSAARPSLPTQGGFFLKFEVRVLNNKIVLSIQCC